MGQILKFGNTEGIDQKLVEIAPGLWQGSRGPAQDDEVLRQHKITQVLSITRVTLQPLQKVCRWTLSMDDNLGWSREQVEFTLAFFRFIDRNGCNAIVHCDHGASRSSGAIILWKMLNYHVDKMDANLWLRSVNPYSNIHPAIFASLPERI